MRRGENGTFDTVGLFLLSQSKAIRDWLVHELIVRSG